jgi:hypothetical protein
MGEEDGASDRPKVNNSAARPKVYAAWSLKRVEERDFRRRAPTALQVGSRKADFFCSPSKIKYPAVIYTTFLILSQTQIIAHKELLLFRFFHETQQLFEVFQITKTSGSFILIFFHIPRTVVVWFRFLQIPRTVSLRLNFSTKFLNYLELVFIKKNQMPTQHWFLNHISFAHLYGEFLVLILETIAMSGRVPTFWTKHLTNWKDMNGRKA